MKNVFVILIAIMMFILGILVGISIKTNNGEVIIQDDFKTHQPINGIPDIPKGKTLRLEDIDSGLYIDINDEALDKLSYIDRFEVEVSMYMLSEDYKKKIFNKLYYIFNKEKFFDNMRKEEA